MAIIKRLFGNDNTYHKIFDKWVPEEEKAPITLSVDDYMLDLVDGVKRLNDRVKESHMSLEYSLKYLRKHDNE